MASLAFTLPGRFVEYWYHSTQDVVHAGFVPRLLGVVPALGVASAADWSYMSEHLDRKRMLMRRSTDEDKHCVLPVSSCAPICIIYRCFLIAAQYQALTLCAECEGCNCGLAHVVSQNVCKINFATGLSS